jgi:hypothetical protein
LAYLARFGLVRFLGRRGRRDSVFVQPN